MFPVPSRTETLRLLDPALTTRTPVMSHRRPAPARPSSGPRAGPRRTHESSRGACGVSEVCNPLELVRRWQLEEGMMVGHAHPSALPDVRPDLQLAGPAQPVGGVQGRRAARPAARGCGAAPRPAAAPAGLGRPGGPRRTDPGPPG